jgi:hypothetical protein
LISLALSLALTSSGICNPLQKRNLELEARVGIGRFTSVFRGKNTKFHQQMQATLALPGRTIAYPLTEGFTETFTEGFQSMRFNPLTIP